MKEPPVSSGAQRTRARILEAATRLFQGAGYRRVSIEAVAREAQVAKGSVYVHFKNKAELLFHAVVQERRQLVGPFRELLSAELTPEDRLRRFIQLALTTAPRAPLTVKLISGDREMLLFLEELPEDLREEVRRSHQTVAAKLLEGVGQFDQLSPPERERRVRALGAILMSLAPAAEERARGGLSLEAYADQVGRILVNGVGAS